MPQKRLGRRAANVSDKLHPSDVNCARDVTASSVNLMHTPQSGLAPPGATNGSSPEEYALIATRVQGTPDSASSKGSPDTSNDGNRHSFHVASAPKVERDAAHKRIQKALDKVPTQVSMNRTGDRMSRDLYVGNLPFQASDDDLFKSIKPCFKRIRIEKVTVPKGKGGQNRGYGFIRLSWAKGAPIDPADICIQLTGKIEVNSRLIYLCETDDTTCDHSESATGPDSPPTSNLSDPEQQDTAFAGYFSPSGGESEYCSSCGDSDQE